MMYKLISLFVLAASINIARAQNTTSHSLPKTSSIKSSASGQSETKPLTPKSAMPAQRKSSGTMPNLASAPKANAELSTLERKNSQTPRAPAKTASVAKANVGATRRTSPSPNSAINFKYRKPTGGMQASNPGANSKSQSLRVQNH